MSNSYRSRPANPAFSRACYRVTKSKTQPSTKVTLDLFTELRRRLAGSCKEDCPKIIYLHGNNRIRISRDLMHHHPINNICTACKEFYFISCENQHEKCPCYRKPNPEELFLYLDEFIQSLQETLSRQYSA